MSFRPVPVKATTGAAVVIWLTAGLWVFRGYVWPLLSNVEVAVLQALLDPSLFRHDFAVQSSLGFTPRFYWNALILLPARAGLPLAASFALGHLAVLLLLATAWRALVAELRLGAVAGAFLGTAALCASAGTIGGVYVYTHAPVPAAWAAAAVAWGAVHLVRRQPVAAFACFGAAVLLQFLVGLYAGLLAWPALLAASRRQQVLSVVGFALALAAVYLPMRWSGGTESQLLDSAGFVELYAQLRLPHHLVPSTWGWATWVQFAWFYLGAIVLLERTRDPAAGRTERTVLVATVAAVAAALLVNYVFVELQPSALVAKLQPARITPLAQLVILALLARRIEALVAARRWAHAVAIGFAVFSPQPGLLLLLTAILPPGGPGRAAWPRWLLLAAVALAFQPFAGHAMQRLLHYGPALATFGVFVLGAGLAAQPRLAVAAAALGVAGAAVCTTLSLRPGWPSALADHFAPDAQPRPPDAPGRLGTRFGQRMPVDAVVLVPPERDTFTFKLFARRADVVDTKAMPFTDAGMVEWRRRLETILRRRLTPGADLAAAWAQLTPADLAAAAHRYGARYVLTRDEIHPQLPGHRIDADQGWSVWELP